MDEPKHRRLRAAAEAVRRRWMTVPQAALCLRVGAAEIRMALGLDVDVSGVKR